jgi:hypothetical protein
MIDWEHEKPRIAAFAAHHGVDPDFIESIRFAENGAPGREFGVLSVRAPSYEAQLNVCCASVAHRLSEYDGNPLAYIFGKLRYRREFARAFAARWAPMDAQNDPDRLNVNWLDNVWGAYQSRINKPAESPLEDQ